MYCGKLECCRWRALTSERECEHITIGVARCDAAGDPTGANKRTESVAQAIAQPSGAPERHALRVAAKK